MAVDDFVGHVGLLTVEESDEFFFVVTLRVSGFGIDACGDASLATIGQGEDAVSADWRLEWCVHLV